ncbi:MAG TPA: tetratricopeptide repeat protein [Candidatus Polarisedimenticolia bacterium]|nr:tetratricopeptide repeat protein [Candidatus Polarisedimenticolia bacterium]
MGSRTALLLVALLGAAILSVRFFEPVDDAYISYRYAENLAAGRGLVFNPGEKVEGYSNFLWVISLALCKVLGASVPVASQWLGLVLTLGTILVAADLGRRLTPGFPWGGVPSAVLLASYPPLAAWAGGGMEVPLFSFLSLLTASLFAAERPSGRRPWRWPLACCLAAMARPEGVLLFLIALGVWIAFPGPRRLPILRRAAEPLLPFLAAGVPYFIGRWIYYGSVLPNTFAAKSGFDTVVLHHGTLYLINFLLLTGGAPLVLGALLAVGSASAVVTLLLVQAFSFTLYVVLIGGDAYPYVRFLVPVAVLLAPAAEVGYRRAWDFLSSRWSLSAGRKRAIASALLILLCGIQSTSSFAGPIYQEFRRGSQAQEGRRRIGIWLKRTAPPDAWVALNPVGLIPYVSGLPTLDKLGLTDAHIARQGKRVTNRVLVGHNRYDAEYVLSRRPEILILGQAALLQIDPVMADLRRPGPATFEAIAPGVVSELPGFPGDLLLWKMPLFRRLYTPTIVSLEGGYFFYFALDHRAAELEDRFRKGSGSLEERAEMSSILASKGETEMARREAQRDPTQDPPGDLEKAVQEALSRMEAHLQRGDVAAAERDLQEGLAASPHDAELLFNLGVLYEQTSRPNEAAAAYQKSVASDPSHPDAWNNLGTLFARQGNLRAAKECWERAVSLNPSSPAAENLRRLAASP